MHTDCTDRSVIAMVVTIFLCSEDRQCLEPLTVCFSILTGFKRYRFHNIIPQMYKSLTVLRLADGSGELWMLR